MKQRYPIPGGAGFQRMIHVPSEEAEIAGELLCKEYGGGALIPPDVLGRCGPTRCVCLAPRAGARGR